jgi:hypothetical protein
MKQRVLVLDLLSGAAQPLLCQFCDIAGLLQLVAKVCGNLLVFVFGI